MFKTLFCKLAICVIAAFLVSSHEGKAQRFAVSTDLLQWGLVSPNVGFEAAISQHHGFSFSASASPFRISDGFSFRHLTVAPEYKYWFNMPFYGHYAGASVLYSSYDIHAGKIARTGNLIAACATYGYSLIIGRRWNLVPHAGIGVGIDAGAKTSFVPLVAKLGINIQLMVK